MPMNTVFNILLYCMQLCWGQNDSTDGLWGNNPESWVHLQDSVIKKEIAQFSLTGASLRGQGEASGATLKQVQLKRCNDTFAYFEKGSLYASEVLIDIFLTGAAANQQIEKISLLFYKTPLELPDSAFKGIYAPKVCTRFTGKNKPVAASCRAFRSADKRRVYIYMLNGEGERRYEVTWVVQDRKYLTRIIDAVPG